MEQIRLKEPVKSRFLQLLEEKMNGRELGMSPPEHALNIYIENEISRILTRIGTRPNKVPDHNVLNNLLWNKLGL